MSFIERSFMSYPAEPCFGSTSRIANAFLGAVFLCWAIAGAPSSYVRNLRFMYVTCDWSVSIRGSLAAHFKKLEEQEAENTVELCVRALAPSALFAPRERSGNIGGALPSLKRSRHHAQ
jgi:hypothetical protein